MTTRPFDKIRTVADLETTADRLGSFFFTPDTMKFFASKVDYKLFSVDGERGFFVTSERYEDMHGNRLPRHWTVRKYAVTSAERNSDGLTVDTLSIDVVEEGYKLGSAEHARQVAEKLQGYAMLDTNAF